MCTVSPKLSKVSRIKCQICRRHGKIVKNDKNIAVLRDATALDLSRLITVSLLSANEVCGKVIFLHLFVILFTGGMPGPRGDAWSRGCLLPGGVCSQRGVCSRGVCSGGGGACSHGGAWWRPPRQLLLLVVCILLECILVSQVSICQQGRGLCLWSHVPSGGLCPGYPPGQRPPWIETHPCAVKSWR